MTYQFKIQLQNIQNPAVWRRVLVSLDVTLHHFHLIIQAVFGWQNYHFYSFSPKGWGSDIFYQVPNPEFDEDYGDDDVEDSQIIELSEIFNRAKQTLVYIYDFGDDWKHKITLEKILDETIINPMCTGGQGTCPPEDCGGPWGIKIWSPF